MGENTNSRRNLDHKEQDNDAWTCAEGFYENGCIIATVPHIDNYDPDNMTYSVDVALNGQQFTGKPVNFRYYDVKIELIEPKFGPQVGGTNIFICGTGLYDAPIKKVRFCTADQNGNREVQAEWDRTKKALKVIVPPFQWLFGDEELSEEQKQVIQLQA